MMHKAEMYCTNTENPVQSSGFTLIELTMVLILIGILASVALPRFLNITHEAHNAAVTSTAGAMSSAIYIAHAKWLALGQPTSSLPVAGIDFLNTGYANVGFNQEGWPNAANAGDKDLQESDVLEKGSDDNQICARIMKNILSQSSITIGIGDNCGQAYCASYKNKQCLYVYEKNKSTPRVVSYSPTTGAVIKHLAK